MTEIVNQETGEITIAAPPPIAKIAAALAKAQAAIQNPPRNREVSVRTKTGGTYKFRYATLDGIIDAIRGPLTDNGLSFVQVLEGTDSGKYRLVTRLLHASGEYLESVTPLLVQGTGNQEFGSALAYMRRYALTALLGVAADEDDDGNAVDGNSIEKERDRGTSNAARQATPQQDDESARLRQDAERIKKELLKMTTVKAVDNMIATNGEALAAIKAFSETAYQSLMTKATEVRTRINNSGNSAA